MTETYKQLAQAVGTAEYLSVYSVPLGSSAVVSTTSVVNTGESGTYSIAAVPSSEYAGIVNTTPGGAIYSQLGQSFIGTSEYQTLGTKVAISRDGNTIAVEYDYLTTRAYSWNGNQWVQKGQFFSTNGLTGIAISSDGNTFITGKSGSQQVNIYVWSSLFGGFWTSSYGGIAGPQAGSNFGSSVDISDSGLTLAVAASTYESGGLTSIGGVYVYDLDPEENTATLRGGVLTGLVQDSRVGKVSLSSNGNTVAYSVPQYDVGGNVYAGAIRIFDWNGTSWVERPQLFGNSTSAFLGIGIGLSADGTVLVATQRADDGSLRAWSWDGSSWQTRGAQLFDGVPNSDYGEVIAISSDANRVVVGGGGTGTAETRIYVYDWDGTDWVQTFSTINNSSGVPSDRVGYSVDISGDGSRLIFSRIGSDENATNNGSVYIYELTNSAAVTELIPLAKHVIVKSKAIDSGEHHEFTGGIVVGAGDRILFSSSTDAVINMSGVEIS